MPIRNQNWYDLQASRRYPLDERSTGIDDAGNALRDSIIVDCNIRFPAALGEYAYVQGITVAPALVTIVFGVGNFPADANGTSIAALSVPRSAPQNVNYELTPLQPGVAGWVVLGPGITEEFAARYTTPQQTLISARCARAYAPLPVTNMGKLGVATSLQGIVKLAGQSPVVATAEKVNVDGTDVDAIVFRLEDGLDIANPLEFFQGPCAQRPESGTCPKPAIETINGISPDCDGNINIVFEGFDAFPYVDCGGVDVVSSIGLAAACAQGEPKSTKVVQDRCYPSQSLSDGDDPYWDPPLPPVPPVIISSESLTLEFRLEMQAALPLCRSFDAGTADDFVTRRGLFVFERTGAPGPRGQDDTAVDSSVTLTEQFTYAAANIVDQNIALFKNCASDWALGKNISVELALTADGLRRNGGLVFNYIHGNPGLLTPTTYMAASIDFDASAVQLLRWNGTSFVVEHTASFMAYIDSRYRLSVAPTLTGSNVLVAVTATRMDDSAPPLTFSVPIPVATYGDPTGQAGLFSDRAYTYFNKFKIEN